MAADDDDDDARRHLADAVRELVQRATLAPAGADQLRSAAALVEQASTTLGPATTRRHGGIPIQEGAWDPRAAMPTHPIFGPMNALSPTTITMHGEGDAITGEVTYGPAYQGPPGRLHGGVVAALFDALQATAAAASSGRALTHTLTIRYHLATPIEEPLALAAHVERVEGRKVFTAATIRAAGALTAESTGFFIRPEPPEATA